MTFVRIGPDTFGKGTAEFERGEQKGVNERNELPAKFSCELNTSMKVKQE